ncbi:hypothetical protein N7471_010234 [Penicillium samsonianum]|uniref:uncharacterized protein n=1 Tax=Penicillium samsonianum TaxID=1882272 RepID=UPI0025489BC2|nr:uncharacterized protein N7471_010234 [Penicillium samsonianum]KAJ6129017.1 hypothetical protein N7471_010234 [Penicillium samsonianum]
MRISQYVRVGYAAIAKKTYQQPNANVTAKSAHFDNVKDVENGCRRRPSIRIIADFGSAARARKIIFQWPYGKNIFSNVPLGSASAAGRSYR